MDGFLGADTDQLLDMGRRVKSAGARCAELADALAAASEGLEWRGCDGDVFRDRVRREAAEALRDAGARLDAGSRALGTQAAQQDAVSDLHGELDDARYAELMGAQGLWSDLTNAGQDLWNQPLNPFADPMTIDDLGGQYVGTDAGRGFDPAEVDLSPEAIGSQTMRQGSIGDCWLLAALMAVAASDPSFLSRSITLREDGTWDVTLYEGGEPVVVNVAPEQIAADGARVDDDGADCSPDDEPIGFMSIYEQAAVNHLGPDYESVIADTPGAGLELITGQRTPDDSFLGNSPTFEEFETAVEEKRPITVMTKLVETGRGDVAPAHVYQVSGVDRRTGELILENSWGDGGPDHLPQTVRIHMDDYDDNVIMAGIGAKPEDFGTAS